MEAFLNRKAQSHSLLPHPSQSRESIVHHLYDNAQTCLLNWLPIFYIEFIKESKVQMLFHLFFQENTLKTLVPVNQS
jgi:hypothetical protein